VTTEKERTLYRKEFIDSRGSKTTEILIRTSISMKVTTLACLIFILMFFLFLSYGEYTRKVKLTGVVMPSTGIINIKSDTEGQILETFVKEGDKVKINDKLYQVSEEKYDSVGNGVLVETLNSISQQKTILKQQHQHNDELTDIKINYLKSKKDKLTSELKINNNALDLARRELFLKKEAEKRFKKLLRKGFVSELAFQNNQIEVVIANEKVEEQRLTLHRIQKEILSVEENIETLFIDKKNETLAFRNSIQELKQRQIEISTKLETTINSPINGTVSAILSKPGQKINRNNVMLTLVPENAKLQVELYASSRSIGFVKEDQKVGLKFIPFPYEKFGIQHGKVIEVSRSSLALKDIITTVPLLSVKNENYYRIIIQLDKESITAYGKEEPLLVGMAVSANIELDTRFLYEWLFEPLWALKGNL